MHLRQHLHAQGLQQGHGLAAPAPAGPAPPHRRKERKEGSKKEPRRPTLVQFLTFWWLRSACHSAPLSFHGSPSCFFTKAATSSGSVPPAGGAGPGSAQSGSCVYSATCALHVRGTQTHAQSADHAQHAQHAQRAAPPTGLGELLVEEGVEEVDPRLPARPLPLLLQLHLQLPPQPPASDMWQGRGRQACALGDGAPPSGARRGSRKARPEQGAPFYPSAPLAPAPSGWLHPKQSYP